MTTKPTTPAQGYTLTKHQKARLHAIRELLEPREHVIWDGLSIASKLRYLSTLNHTKSFEEAVAQFRRNYGWVDRPTQYPTKG